MLEICSKYCEMLQLVHKYRLFDGRMWLACNVISTQGWAQRSVRLFFFVVSLVCVPLLGKGLPVLLQNLSLLRDISPFFPREHDQIVTLSAIIILIRGNWCSFSCLLSGVRDLVPTVPVTLADAGLADAILPCPRVPSLPLCVRVPRAFTDATATLAATASPVDDLRVIKS